MIILAIFPILIPIAALFAFGGLFAFMGKKKKAAAEDETDAAGDLDKPTPAPDPMTPGIVPFIEVRSGTTYVRLDRRGETWSFRVEGPVPATGGDSNPGKAAIDMLQSFAASNNTDDVTGDAASADGTVLEFGVQDDDGGRWEWSVTGKLATDSSMEMLASGEEKTRTTALLKTLAALSDALDWLNIPSKDGGGVQKPPPEPPTAVHGIVTTGNALAVVNINAWRAYASPLVREDLEAGKTADQIMGELLDPDNIGIDDDYTFSGKPGSDVRVRVGKIYDEIKEGKYLGTASPDDELATAIVGYSYKPKDNFVMRWNGSTLLVRPRKGGGNAASVNIDTRYEYLIWTGDMRGYDTDAVTETMAEGKKRNQAISAAKAAIDGLPNADDGATVDPDWSDPGGANPGGANAVANLGLTVGTKPPPPIDVEGTRTLDISAPTWQQRATKDVVIFDFDEGQHRFRKDWTISVGLCITRDSDKPFGTLSHVLDGSNPGVDNAFADPLARFQIRNKPESAIDWESFDSPLAFKRAYLAKFERTGAITKQLEEITITDEFDMCPDLQFRWPTPTNDVFLVQKVASQYPTEWDPLPRARLVVSGKKLLLRLTFSGLPAFTDQEGGMSPALVMVTPYKLKIHTWASGINL